MDDAERKRKNAEYMREWNRRNPDKVRATRQKQAANPEHREKTRQRAAAWYAANRERVLAAARERYAADPDPHPQQVPTPYKGASYYKLHRWITEQKGRPSKCEHCGTEAASRYEWANVDHQYRPELEDWVRLCRSCHRRYDLKHGLTKKGGRPRLHPEDRA